jgi:hypothetical protein
VKSKAPDKETSVGDTEVAICRRRDDRRQSAKKTETKQNGSATEQATITQPTTFNPPERRKVPRRRQIDPTTCERDYTDDEIEFMHALDAYKRSSGRMFPTCSEILEVVRGLGYLRLTPEELKLIEVDRPETSDETEPVSLASDDEFA